MTLAPEIRSLLDWGASLAEIGSLPLPQRRLAVRNELDRELRRRGVVVEPVAATLEERVGIDGEELRVRLFIPVGAAPHGAFVHFHGGGFVFGTIDSLVNDAKCAHICRAAGCVVATVEYRLAPEYRFPTAVNDCYEALSWLAANAGRLGIDPDRIAVGGESAGGNLAAAVALMARDRGGPKVALQLLEVPVTDIGPHADDYPSVALFGENFGLDRAEMDVYAQEYLADLDDGSSPYASPVLAADVTGVAPAHVITAEFDMLRDSGEAYAHRLHAAGVRTTLHRRLGHNHGSSVLWQEWGPARAWMDEVVDALRHALTDRGVERR